MLHMQQQAFRIPLCRAAALARAANRSIATASSTPRPSPFARSLWAAAAAAAAACLGAGGAAWAGAADAPPQPHHNQQQQPSSSSSDGASRSQAAAAPWPTALPTDKLSCKRAAVPPRSPVVLVSAGSFNPPTFMHLRMCEVAANALAERGYDVWGCYLSPVGDSYGKPGLAPAADRLEMCRLAAERSDLIMVDGWEAAQAGYTRTLALLRRFQSELDALFPPPTAAGQALALAAAAAAAVSQAGDSRQERQPAGMQQQQQQQQQQQREKGAGSSVGSSGGVRVMLLCGGDLLASMTAPGVWKDPDVLLEEFGAVCVAREGTDLEQLLGDDDGSSSGDGGGSPVRAEASREPAAAGMAAAKAAAAAAGGGGDRAAGTGHEPNVLRRHRSRIVVVHDPLPNSVSSTRVRAELAAGWDASHLAPAEVLRYARERGLYCSGGGGGTGQAAAAAVAAGSSKGGDEAED